ncbi:F-box protein At5g49610-like [Rhodamnia argentea]|uniref:F-box protein At5g49610-like n=1 Tax=Rhodamnia argentea TaxID=178133 RepID=A0A8B8P9X8_9MYRT|nr:F-box protein At5g49610-like [Rhodamnia argentea]
MEKSDKRSNNSNVRIPYLSLEIISEILCKLPIDSILRCRCVCKAWCYLTKNPTFIEQLLDSSVDKQPGLILEPFCADDSTQPFLLVDIEGRRVRQIHIDPLKGLRAMGTCRGLLCVGSPSALDPVFVCNPITREYRRLPTSGETDIGGHEVGLGFDPSAGKYKVLRTYVNEGRRFFEVTTLGESSWRRLDVPDGWQAYFVYQPIFWNGAIHWRTSRKGRDFIISFDVRHEKFRMISFPKDVHDFDSRPHAKDVGQFGLGVRRNNNDQLLLPPEVFVPDGYGRLRLRIEPKELELLGFRRCLTIVEHHNEWMRLWEVTGDKLEDLSISFWDEHDTHVRWNPYMTYAVINRLSEECYLLRVSACYGNPFNRKMHFTYFFPKRVSYQPLDIPGLPPMFRTVRGYEPSLVSPETV